MKIYTCISLTIEKHYYFSKIPPFPKIHTTRKRLLSFLVVYHIVVVSSRARTREREKRIKSLWVVYIYITVVIFYKLYNYGGC